MYTRTDKGGKLSFKDLNSKELDEVLKRASGFFGFDVPEKSNKQDKLALLANEGVTWEQYQQYCVSDEEKEEARKAESQANVLTSTDLPEVKEEESPEQLVAAAPERPALSEEVLIYMQSGSASFQVRGYKFTLTHPFHLMKREDADYVTRKYPHDFRPAYADEVREYYG